MKGPMTLMTPWPMMPAESSRSVGGGELPVRGQPVHAAHGGGGQVPDGLDGVDDVHNGQGGNGGGNELDFKGHDGGQGNPGGSAYAGQVHDSHKEGGNIAHNHSEQQGAQLPDALGEIIQVDDHREGQQSHRPAAQAAEPGAESIAASHVAHSGGIQGQTDGENHGACHQGREEHPDFLDEDAEENGHKAAGKLCPQNGGQVELHSDGGEGGDVGKADAHNHRQPCADAAENGEQLQKGGNGGDDQGRLDEDGFVRNAQVAHIAAGDDDGGSNNPYHGSNHVLQAKWDELPRRGDSIVGKDAGGSLLVGFHIRISSFCVG